MSAGNGAGKGHRSAIGGLGKKVNKPAFTFDIPKPEEETKAEREPQDTKPETPVEKQMEAEKPAQPVEVRESKAEQKEKDHHPRDQEEPADDGQVEEERTGLVGKYKKQQPKYKTHKPLNVRIPISLREDINRIAKKLGHTHPNSGFIQQFTIDALTIHAEKLKKELGLK